MTVCLKIGDRAFNDEQLIAALVQYQLLEPLVGQVLLDSVLRTVPISHTEIVAALMPELDIPSPENCEACLDRWCQIKGITSDYFQTVILRELRLQKFKRLQFADRAESDFLRLQSDLDQVEYSVLQLVNVSLAQELYFQLRDDGASFAQVAAQYSEGPERVMGGLVGPVPLSTVPIEVAVCFRHRAIGKVYGPIPVADRFWVVRLEQFIAARLTAATHSQLVNRLYTQWLQAQTQALMQTPQAIAVETVQPNSLPLAALTPSLNQVEDVYHDPG